MHLSGAPERLSYVLDTTLVVQTSVMTIRGSVRCFSVVSFGSSAVRDRKFTAYHPPKLARLVWGESDRVAEGVSRIAWLRVIVWLRV